MSRRARFRILLRMRRFGRSHALQPTLRAAPLVGLLVLLPSMACVSTPRPIGPVLLEGPVAPTTAEISRAAPVQGATRGPLLLRDATLAAAAGLYRWSAVIENPSDGTLEVTVVATLLDETGGPLEYESLELQLGRGEESRVEGSLAAAGEPVRFRVEYWVRLPPPPDRRLERGES